MERKDAEYERMISAPIRGLVIRMAIPTIVSMMITAVYNMADTWYVSQIDTSASAAVGIVFSLMAIIQAVGFTLGMGSGSLLSRRLGEQKIDEAETYGSSAFFAALLLGAVITVPGIIFTDELMKLLGATETSLPFASGYGWYILLGAPVMCASFVLNNLLRSQGKAILSMVGLGIGALLNIALDPLFIFTFGMGVEGAGLATLISQCVSFAIMLMFLLFGRVTVRLRFSCVSRKLRTYADVLKIGFPSLCRQGLASVATVLLNKGAAYYGDPAVAAMSIVGRLFMFILCVGLGIGQGFQPVAGYNYGAKKYDRVRQAFRFTAIIGTIGMTVLAAVCFAWAPQLMSFFRAEDAKVIEIGTLAVRLQCAAVPLVPLSVCTTMLMQSTGQSIQATLLSCNRQGLFFLPLIALLPRWWGLLGVQITQPLADVGSLFACLPFLILFFKKLNKMQAEQEGKP